MESDDKQRNTKVRQRLPSFDVIHLGFEQIQVFDIGMPFQDFLSQLKIKEEYRAIYYQL